MRRPLTPLEWGALVVAVILTTIAAVAGVSFAGHHTELARQAAFAPLHGALDASMEQHGQYLSEGELVAAGLWEHDPRFHYLVGGEHRDCYIATLTTSHARWATHSHNIVVIPAENVSADYYQWCVRDVSFLVEPAP